MNSTIETEKEEREGGIMQTINIANALHTLAILNGGVQVERALHYLVLLRTGLPSIQKFGCGLALSFTQAACKQARSLRHLVVVRKMQEQQKQVQQVLYLFDKTNYPPNRRALTHLLSGYSAAASFGCY
jgi:hypothetical protein